MRQSDRFIRPAPNRALLASASHVWRGACGDQASRSRPHCGITAAGRQWPPWVLQGMGDDGGGLNTGAHSERAAGGREVFVDGPGRDPQRLADLTGGLSEDRAFQALALAVGEDGQVGEGG